MGRVASLVWPAISAAVIGMGGCCLPAPLLPSAELWKSDGTPGGAVRLKKLPFATQVMADPFQVVGDTFFFGLHETYQRPSDGSYQLWKTDGTPSGTVRVTYLARGSVPAMYSTPLPTTPLDHRSLILGRTLLFLANDGVHGFEVWKSDGTEAGTGPITPRVPGSTASVPTHFVRVGTTAFFLTEHFTEQVRPPPPELWKTDGTQRGTVRVTTLDHASACLAEFDGSLFFTSGQRLWKSNGTPDGTLALKEISSSEYEGGCRASQLFATKGALFVRSEEGLWKSDGSAAGTVLVKRFSPQLKTTSVAPVSIGTTLYFVGENADRPAEVVGHFELWKTDGTGPGTILLHEILRHPGAGDDNLLTVGRRVFFRSDDPERGREPWTTDGTPEGTLAVAYLPSARGTFSGSMAVLGDRVLFLGGVNWGQTGPGGRRGLWATDGTAAGTSLIHRVDLPDDVRLQTLGKAVYWIRPE